MADCRQTSAEHRPMDVNSTAARHGAEQWINTARVCTASVHPRTANSRSPRPSRGAGVRAHSNRNLAVATPFPQRGRPCTLEPRPRGRNTLPVARASVHARTATSRSQHPSRGAGVRARSKRNLAVATPFPRRGRPCTLEPQTRGRTSQVRTPFMRGPGMATSTRSSTRCRRSPHRPHSSPSLPPQPSRCRPAGSVHAGSSPRDESRRTTAGSRG